MTVSANKLAGRYSISIEAILPWNPQFIGTRFHRCKFYRTSLQNPILRFRAKSDWPLQYFPTFKTGNWQ